MIDEAQKAKWDKYAIHKAAIDSGLQQGLEQGLEQGLAQGLAQGLEKGADQKAREIAKKMLLKNKPIEEITEFTELSEAEVLAIKVSLSQS